MDDATPTLEEVLDAVRDLVERERVWCLWHCRDGDLAASPESARLALREIVRHGDRVAFQEARRLEQWLSRTSSDRSANFSPSTG